MAALEKGLVLHNKKLCPNVYELEFSAPHIAPQCQPGQFVHIIAGNSCDPLLRRPLSLYDVDKDRGTITLLYKVVGKGTELLTKVGNNDYVDVMGPLGQGFAVPLSPRRNLLVGGGMGIAPLVFLARVLKERQHEATVLYGVENRLQEVASQRLREIGAGLYTASADGSTGYKGLLTPALFSRDIRPGDFDFLYTCGPEPMMASWLNFARLNRIPGEISLEEHMACGVGACLGCARKLKQEDRNYAKICKDGPVFPLQDVELGG